MSMKSLNYEQEQQLAEKAEEHKKELFALAQAHFQQMRPLDKAAVVETLSVMFDKHVVLEEVVDKLVDYIHDARQDTFALGK